MASPFRYFRKNVKPLLVVFTVLLIIAWLGGGGLSTYMDRPGGGRGGNPAHDANAVAVKWDGGSLTNAQVEDLTVRRRVLNEFLKQVQGAGELRSHQAGVAPPALRVQQMLGPEKPQEGVEQHVVQIRMFADAAREAGMRVSNEAIVEYLDDLGRGNVSRDEMRAILKRFQSSGWNVSIDFVIDALREEMLARNFIASYQYAFATVTPEQRWKDWLRVNDKVVIEAAAIPADKFIVDVKEPTDAQLTEFFDKYKNDDPHPDLIGEMEFPSPNPGFRIPQKIDVQFVQAEYNEFLKKAEAEVSEEEIAKYYEAQKDPLFIKADTDLIDDSSKTNEAAEAPGEEKGTDATPAEKTDADAGQSSEETKAEAAPPVEPSTAPPADEPAPPASDAGVNEGQPAPATSEGDAPKGESEQPAGDGKQSSFNGAPGGVFRLAAFQEKAATGDSPGEAATDTAVTDPTTPVPTADPPAAPSADTAATDSSATPPPSAPATTTEPAATAPPAEKKPVEFEPLDKVRDQIRRQIAESRVQETLGKVADDVEGQLSGEYRKYLGSLLDAQTEKREAPAPPQALVDLAPLAEKNGLQHGRTGPISALEFREMPIGKSGDLSTGTTLVYELFGTRDVDMYQPKATVDVDGNRYIAMKMGDTPARVPKLEEVRKEVVQAWKRENASVRALETAEELAKKAQEAKAPLTDYFADDKSVKVVRTDPFSELTGGLGFIGGRLQPQPFRLSEPDGVVAAGPTFLRSVVALKDGEVGAMLNYDHSIAYVVRMVEHQPPLEELRTAFLGEANMWPGRQVMTSAHAQGLRSALAQDILAGKDLKWERTPDQIEQADDAG